MSKEKPDAKPKIVHTVELEGEKPSIVVQETVYKGRPVLNMIYTGSGYPTVLRMGPGKCRMALYCIPEMKAFLDKHSAKLDAEGPEV